MLRLKTPGNGLIRIHHGGETLSIYTRGGHKGRSLLFDGPATFLVVRAEPEDEAQAIPIDVNARRRALP